MPNNIPIPDQSYPSEKSEWPENTDQIQTYLKTQNLLIPLDMHRNILPLTSAKGLLLGILLGFLLLLVPIPNEFIIRIIIGGLILAAGGHVYNQSMVAIRDLYQKNTVLAWKYTGLLVAGQSFLLGGVTFIFSGAAVFFYELSLVYPELVGIALLNGIFSLVIGWTASFFLGPLGDYIQYLGLILLVFAGSIFLIILFGGSALVLLLVQFFMGISVLFLGIGIFYLVLSSMETPKSLNKSIPFIIKGSLVIRGLIFLWIIISLIGDAVLFTSIFLPSLV